MRPQQWLRPSGWTGVRLIRQANAGKPAALSTGIAAARHDVLVLVDGDTVFEPEAIRALVAPFADPDVGAVSGNTKVGNRRGLLGRWQHIEYVIGFNLDRRMFDVLRCMPTVPGAIGAFRRDALADAGGLARDTLAEDTDLTMAIIRAGWRVVYAPEARAWTEVPATLGQLWRQRYRWCYGTMQAMWKHRGSVFESGPGGRLGRRGLPYLLAFQVVLPLLAPVVDVATIYSILTSPTLAMLWIWLAFLGLQLVAAVYAFRLDREPLGPLWSLPAAAVRLPADDVPGGDPVTRQCPLRASAALAGDPADRGDGQSAERCRDASQEIAEAALEEAVDVEVIVTIDEPLE